MPLTVRLDRSLERRLRAAAADEGMSVSDFVREAISERLDHGAGHASLWDRIAPSLVKDTSKGRRTKSAGKGGPHSEFAAGLEADAAAKWRRLDK